VTGYRLSPFAKSAIADIHDYTLDQWGPKQAAHYIDGLIDVFEKIAARHVLWRPVPPELGVQGFWHRYEQHYVYWRERADGTVSIVAILHTSMHQADRLRETFGS
jgi:plasmid stabilization system protein ParE